MRQAADFEQAEEQAAADRPSLERELLHASREVHRLSREVEALRQALGAERVEREDLLAIVSHEVRTPLTVIRGYLRLLLAGEAGALGEEQRRFLSETQRSSDKLDAFVTRVLDSTRVYGDVGALEVASAPLAPLVDEVAKALRGPLADRGLRFENRADPAHEARFDRHGVERVLLNLVGNAVRFARREIWVDTRLCEGERPLVEVLVHDDGPGVPEGERQRVFMPYVHEADGGVGLGLSLCRRLVEAHGGTIRVEPGPAGGSCFRFTLPGREA